ncbi:MAG: sucrose-specific PTS transporter subunit IIBC [Solobacterium sp.]|jgi:sucrose-specific phosphotransferase system IIBC component|nr:sucrose-specific PTS transporter subunit IIBC [Solobacterium sp.]MCH4206118.1 sucrose-specific PTS transporter subunit IIBC [Solobacterium sp.]MCH4227584.1 sucrose-specific PTS transporter subunit IIBC [Solobacterium sp.]MCH4283008.1 sucrose-specific PTS transporter subunit IIBC [Solobacterium sp.]
MDYRKIAQEIIQNVGGKENISSVMHCATRLRLTLKDTSKINEEKVTDIEAVKGVFMNKGQYQIILGSGTVNLVYDEVIKITGDEKNEPEEEKPEGNMLNRFIKMLSDIFVPIIPAIVAGGLLMGINNVLTAQGLFVAGKSLIELYPGIKDLASMINLFSNAAFTFLPVLIGFSATKKFGGNPYLGAALGMIMVHPDLLNAYSYGTGVAIPTWNIFGLSIEAVGYQGTVLPILVMSFILAKLEIKLHKITPSWLDNLTTPLLCILICGFLTFTIVGPVMRGAGNLLTLGITWLYNTLGPIGGAIFGFFYAPICLTGMHHSFIAVETQLIASVAVTGGSFIFITAAMNNVAQGAAVLAVLFSTKDPKQKSICSASGVSALLGITEPAMFGVTLKLKYPFYAAMIGSAVGSAYCAFRHVLAVALGAAGLPGFISVAPASWVDYFIGMAISMITAFAITWVLFRKHAKEEAALETEGEAPIEAEVSEHTEAEEIRNTAAGNVQSIEKASDEAFSSKSMGDGFVVDPEDGRIYAPFDGKVSLVFPTKHAIGLVSDAGTELLIHMGIDTVKLNGEGFDIKVKAEDTVKQGQLLAVMDLDTVRKAGYSPEICCVFTNKKDIAILNTGKLKENTVIASVK